MKWAAYQLAWLADRSPRKSVVKSRRIGFSEVVAYEIAEGVTGLNLLFSDKRTKPVDEIIGSASHAQAKELLDKVLHHLKIFERMGLCEIIAESKTKIEVRSGKYVAKVIALSSNPRSFRGYTGNLTLDEFGNTAHQDAVWRGASPVAKATFGAPRGYKIRIVGTPEGDDNMFHEINRGKLSRHWSLHTVSIHDAQRAGFPVLVMNDEKQLVPGTVEALREQEGTETFEQEYECNFTPANRRFISAALYDACVYDDEDTTDEQELPSGDGPVFGGLDIAGTSGLGDLWSFLHLQRRITPAKGKRAEQALLWHIETDSMRAPANDNGGAPRNQAQIWDDQEDWADLHAMRCTMVGVDATAIGAQFGARLEQRWAGRIRLLNFSSAPVREEVVTAIRTIMERRGVRLRASDRELRRDVLALRRTVTAAGTVRVHAPRTARGHADRAFALGMAVVVSGDHVTGGKGLPEVPAGSPPARQKPSIWGSGGQKPGKLGI